MAEKALVAAGSNIDPIRYLPAAVARLAELGRIAAVSRVYQNPAVGPGQQPDYLNAAVLLETDLTPHDIRRRLRAIEASLGRVRGEDRYAARTIDLDLCLYGAVVVETPELTLPCPDVLQRGYLAVTLAEVAPDFPHPLTGEPLRAIAERLRPAAPLTPRPDVVLPAPDALRPDRP
ncbi:MAG: 2-amino-4-hydroxy-6-hydroxymethyldihydropteridine diphosphokinase [Phycisphaerae bacterium]